MKIPKRFSPKRLFRSKKYHSADVSRSDPPSFGSGTSSSSSSSETFFKPNATATGYGTPTSVLPPDWPDSGQRENDGVVSRKELEAILSRIASEEEVAMMLSEVSSGGGGGDGFIWLEELMAQVGTGVEAAGESELRETFEFFDADQDGRITAEELHEVFRSIGDEQCTLEDCRRMIRDVDENGDGVVCFAEFVRMMELQG
ncbi:probable calcium-binding protein CML35 [Benincasa hispida]|uniref:probable calcium-binding protein CML35 n=1 Tax=Benincasa hispida TaxID=102211 RepID=UPI0018FFA43A|nr:probable calcium-binding protein CML35 [Benincasa hispida]